MTEKESNLLQEVEALRGNRASYVGLWKDLADMCMPRKQLFNRGESLPNMDAVEQMIDTTALECNQTLASGQLAHITPRDTPWFSLSPPAEIADNQEAVRWYSLVTDAVRIAIANSNFYNQIHEAFLDRGCFGISAMQVSPGRGGVGLHFQTFDIDSYSIAEDEFQTVSTICRDYKLTAAQACALFGHESMPEQVLKDYVKGSQDKHTFCQYIRPNRKHDRDNLFSKAFESFDLFIGKEKKLIREGGYHEFPVAVSRWQKWGENNPYGYSPAIAALPVAYQVNHMEVLGDYLSELQAFPRFLHPASMKGDLNLAPGTGSVFDPNLGTAGQPREWLTGGRFDVLEARLSQKRDTIRKAFFADLFDLLNNLSQTMTKFEVEKRLAEKAALFHPIFVRAITEKLTPLVMRSYYLLARQPGMLPPPPRSVITYTKAQPEIADPDVRYTTALALSMQGAQTQGLGNVLELMGAIAQFDPTAMDAVNTGAIYPHIARSYGLPESFIRTPDDIEVIQQGRAQAQQLAQAQQMADTVQKAGGAEGIQQLGQLQ